MRRRTCSPSELRVKQARINLKKRLADLLDYMDTLDRSTWDELKLYSTYNACLDTFNSLYSSNRVVDKEKEDEEIHKE